MPTALQLDGLTIYRPGVYATVDASALGGKGTSTGNLAIIGAFPSLENDQPLTFSAPKAVFDYDPADAELARLAKLAFSPSTDGRVPGGANTLTLLNVGDVEQASYTFKDDSANDSLKVTSKHWGKKGNRVWISMEQNATDANAVDVDLARGTQSESFAAISSGKLLDIYYNGADATEMTFECSPTTFKMKWAHTTATFAAAGGDQTVTWAVTKVLTTGTIGAKWVEGIAVGKIGKVTITGKNVTGAAQVVELNYTAANESVLQTTGEQWSDITSIAFFTDDAAYNGKGIANGQSFDLDPSEYAFVKDMTDLVDNNNGKGYYATTLQPYIAQIPADELDTLIATDCFGAAKANPRADLWALAKELNKSAFVTAARTASAVLPPKHYVGPVPATEAAYLAGGTESAITAADWTAALTTIEASDVQVVVPMSNSLAIHQAIVTHCKNAAVAGHERNAWVGAAPDKTAQEVFDGWTSLLNSRHISVTGQTIQVYSPVGALEWLDPNYLAVMFAGMQCGTVAGTPLTEKRPSVIDVGGEWSPVTGDDDVIKKGIAALTRDNLGWKVLRSVTCYLTDDNPVYSEMSANESVNTSIRTLRNSLISRIGNPSTSITPARFKGGVEAVLDRQVLDGVIKAYAGVVIEDLGDIYRITYQLAPVEPINFIHVHAQITRLAA